MFRILFRPIMGAVPLIVPGCSVDSAKSNNTR